MKTIMIITHTTKIEWLVRDEISTIASGTDLLKSVNGDYDSLLSNAVNRAASFLNTPANEIDFIFRKGR